MGTGPSGPAGGPPAYEYDISPGESPSVAVVTAVHEFTGRSVTDLAPLGSLLSADALDELCESLSTASPPVEGHVEFAYEGLSVRVVGTGTVELRT